MRRSARRSSPRRLPSERRRRSAASVRSTRRSLLVGAAALFVTRRAAARSYASLFRIERSKNANIVQYDAVLAAEDALDARGPVVCYWVLHAEDGRREPITALERRAYGFKVVRERGESWLLYLNATRDRSVRILRWQGRWVAQIVIAARSAVLTRIFVASDESGLIPRVRWIDLFGVDMITGKPLTERLVP